MTNIEILRENFPQYTFTEMTVTKTNGAKDGIMVKKDRLGAILYKDQFADVEEMIKFIKNDLEFPKFDTTPLYFIEEAINFEKNKELLENVNYRQVADLAIIKRGILKQGSFIVTKEYEEKNNVTVENEYCENSPFPTPGMFVLSNKDGLFGSGVIGCNKILDEWKEKIGDFYILPSSVHEIILLPKKDGMDVSEIRTMVQEINEAEVSVNDFLSDNVYEYVNGKVVVA